MKAQNASKLVETWSSQDPKGLKPDDDTKELAQIAKSNGKVEAKGENSKGIVEVISTAKHPILEKVTYDPDVEKRIDALRRIAAEIVGKVRRGNQ